MLGQLLNLQWPELVTEIQENGFIVVQFWPPFEGSFLLYRKAILRRRHWRGLRWMRKFSATFLKMLSPQLWVLFYPLTCALGDILCYLFYKLDFANCVFNMKMKRSPMNRGQFMSLTILWYWGQTESGEASATASWDSRAGFCGERGCLHHCLH